MPSEAAQTLPTHEASKGLNLAQFSLIAVVVGLITGLGAVLFRFLIAIIHNAMMLGTFSWIYDANQHTPASPWGPLIILVPVLGGLVVTFLVTNYAPEAKGHGVPEVMDAVFYREGRIRPAVAAIKSLASGFSIGSGAAVGREGPIIQIGSAIGSTIGQILKMEPWQRITLVSAGAGAGIAATFNTPIGGVLFAIELLLPEVSVRTFLPVALSTGMATFIGHFFFGLQPAFHAPPVGEISGQPSPVFTLLLYVVLGALAGVAATAFIRGLHFAEGAFERVHNPYLRHVVGMLFVGTMMYVLLLTAGHYYVGGVGYATVQDILVGGLWTLPLLSLLFVCKLTATSVSLGSGASGGIFSPSLYMGATLGGAVGALSNALIPSAHVSVPAFAMVGMAAMVGGGTGAAMTAVTMIFEMTRDYDIVTPMIVAVAVSIGVRRLLSRENIYTIKLLGRRHFIPKALHANMFLVRRAVEVADKEFMVLPADTGLTDFLYSGHSARLHHLVLTAGGEIKSVLRINTALRRGQVGPDVNVPLGDLASPNFIIAGEEDVMFTVIDRMWKAQASMVVVVKSIGVPTGPDVVGIITKEHVADSVADSIKPYAYGHL